MKLVQGRALNPDIATDEIEGIVVNTAFVEKTSLIDPLDKVVTLHDRRRRIVGVVENHIDHVMRSERPESFVFLPVEKSRYSTLLVKTEPGNLVDVQKYLQTTWKQLFPAKPFENQ